MIHKKPRVTTNRKPKLGDIILIKMKIQHEVVGNYGRQLI